MVSWPLVELLLHKSTCQVKEWYDFFYFPILYNIHVFYYVFLELVLEPAVAVGQQAAGDIQGVQLFYGPQQVRGQASVSWKKIVNLFNKTTIFFPW